MKKLLLGIVFSVLFSSPALAWYPAQDWVYIQYPHAYSTSDSAWYYLNVTDYQYAVNLGTGQWSRFGTKPANGWVWFNWPYAYSMGEASWYYFAEDNTFYVYNTVTHIWSRLGYLGSGDVQIKLTWDNTSDTDLWVRDPALEWIGWSHRTSASGGQLDRDDVDGYGPENIFWPTGGAPLGAYEVRVKHYSGPLPVHYQVVMKHGSVTDTRTGTLTTTKQDDLVTVFQHASGDIMIVDDQSNKEVDGPKKEYELLR